MNLAELSKEISYALRHAPEEYGLELDDGGWAKTEQLLLALRKKEKYKDVSEKDLMRMMESSPKKRHECADGKIRALYGHSTKTTIEKTPRKPPETLYHGTARRFVESIMREGLLPQTRQKVHVSEDLETATAVGARHDAKPVVLKINAIKAYEDGVQFYYVGDKIWQVDCLSSNYLEQL